jgi:hypothetical protein
MCIISDGEIDYLTISILLSAQKNASRPSHIHLQPADHKIIRPPPSQTGQCISTSVHAAAVQTHRGLHPYYMPGARLGKFTEPPETPGPWSAQSRALQLPRKLQAWPPGCNLQQRTSSAHHSHFRHSGRRSDGEWDRQWDRRRDFAVRQCSSSTHVRQCSEMVRQMMHVRSHSACVADLGYRLRPRSSLCPWWRGMPVAWQCSCVAPAICCGRGAHTK